MQAMSAIVLGFRLSKLSQTATSAYGAFSPDPKSTGPFEDPIQCDHLMKQIE